MRSLNGALAKFAPAFIISLYIDWHAPAKITRLSMSELNRLASFTASMKYFDVLYDEIFV